MIWPVASLMVALRSPFTATVDVTPSFAAFPPNMLNIRPSIPANSTCDFWSDRTSARSEYDDRTSSATDTAAIFLERLMDPPGGLQGALFSIGLYRQFRVSHYPTASGSGRTPDCTPDSRRLTTS